MIVWTSVSITSVDAIYTQHAWESVPEIKLSDSVNIDTLKGVRTEPN